MVAETPALPTTNDKRLSQTISNDRAAEPEKSMSNTNIGLEGMVYVSME